MPRTDLEFLSLENSMKPTRPPMRSILEYVQGRRIMPTSSPAPGPYNINLTPYWKEPMESMGPFSPIQEENWMKGHQIAATTTAENIIAYWMDECPTDILYVSATEELLEEWSTKRIDPLIDSLGFRHKIAAQTENRKSRRSGDKVLSKEFPGGSLKMTSARSAGNLRSMSRRVIIKDELDGAPVDLKTGEGNYSDVADARASAWGPRKKILNLGTPGIWEQSLIRQKYEAGDQRKYLVPCPYCQREQELVLLGEEAAYGLRAETKAGELVRAYYLCEHCHDAFFDYHKTEILARGLWVATKPSSSPFIVSRHLSSLYSPMGMLSWTDLYRKYLDSRGDPEKIRAFVTLYLGWPYKEEGSRPDLRKVISLRGTYKQGQVQQGVIYLTAAVDVQRGKDKPENPEEGPRLEMEVLGHGRSYKTWSVDHRVFLGPIEDPFSGAWEKLNAWVVEDGGLKYPHAKGAKRLLRDRSLSDFFPETVLVDSGDQAHIVYAFCGRWRNTYPCKGAKVIVADPERREKGDIAATAYKRYRQTATGDGQVLYEINTQFYKAQLYNKLSAVPRRPIEPQASGFQDFPLDYEDEYFAQLAAEEQLADGSFRKVRARNEALDLRVYNMAAGDIFLWGVVDMLRREAVARGATMKWAEHTIDSKYALDWLEKMWIVYPK